MEYKTTFYLQVKKDPKTGKKIVKDCNIRFTFIFDGQMASSTAGIKCDVIQWNQAKQQFKSSSANATAKNETLKQITEQLEKIYLDGKNAGDPITPTYILDRFRNRDAKNFFDYFDVFTKTAGKNAAWTDSTYAKFKTLRMHLTNFEQQDGQPLDFAHVDGAFNQRLFDYFTGIGHRNSTIKKTFKLMTWFYTWSIENQKAKIPNLTKFKIIESKEATKTADNLVFLYPDEFILMTEAVIPDLRLMKVKDIFVFLCATGLRWSDYAELKPSHIVEDSIKLMTIKTGTNVTIPLNPFSRAILEKYNNQLPKYSNQRLNSYIKEVAEHLNLDRIINTSYILNGKTVRESKPLKELITVHSSRRTFISLSVFLNMNVEVLMKFTGHHKHETLKQYLGFSNGQKVSQMAVFNPENMKLKIAE